MLEQIKRFLPDFSDERTRIITGILLICTGIFLALSFTSFLFTWDADQSELLQKNSFQYIFSTEKNTIDPALKENLNTLSEVEPEVTETQNWGGKLGALVSKKFIHDWFGVSSFLFIFISIIWGLFFLKFKFSNLKGTIFVSFLSILLFSITLGYIFTDSWDANIGGYFGYFVSYIFLGSLVGRITAGLIIFILLSTYILFAYKSSLAFFKQFAQSSIENENVQFDDTSNNEDVNDEDNTEQEIEPEMYVSSDTEETLSHKTEPLQKEIIEPILNVKNSDEPIIEHVHTTEFEIKHTPIEEVVEEHVIDESIDTEIKYENPVELEVEDLEITNTMDNSDEAEFISTELQDYDPTLDLSHYKLPPIDLLENHQSNNTEVSSQELSENKIKIEETLKNYNIQIDRISATIGPTITLYEIVPAAGVRISKIKNLEDDIALSLAALGIRIIAPIPGKGTIGIEVPNKNPEIVSMRSIIASKTFQEAKMDLPVALGKTISNETYVFDLAKMPHLLVAGATGQGKSVGLNAIMTSLLYKKHPAQLKFVLIDPKKVELTLYQSIEKHFLAKLPDEEDAIITDTQKVVNTLNSLCIEMDTRYDLLKDAKLRNIKEYNERFISRRLNPEKGHRYLPYIVVVIDEFADLIITAGKEIELPLARLAQLARAIGIHLIIATQRPAANIITGAIKANFPARMAFRVASGIDSRTILDATGANQLIGKGDMLINKGSDLIRVQCAFIDTPEVEQLTNYISRQQSYTSAFPLPEYKGNETSQSFSEDNDLDALDSMFEDAARIIVLNQQGSTSLLQRKLKLGYNRAGRIMDQLESYEVVGAFEGSKARQVLIGSEQSLEQLLERLRQQGKL